MKQVILLLVLVAAALAVPRVKRQLFKEQNPRQVPQILANEAAVNTYVKCVLATPEEAAKICEKIGKRLREIIPGAIEKGDCPSACNADEKTAMAYIIRTMKEKYPIFWTQLIAHFKGTPAQVSKVEKWAAAIPPFS